MENSLSKGWIETSLEELLISLESGSRPKGGVRGISDGIPSLGGEHLNYDGGFDFTNIKYVPKQFASLMNKGQIEQEDILIVKDGATTGKTSFVDDKFPFNDAVVNEHVFICRPSKKISSKYLFWYLWSDEGNKRILENFKGSAQGGINKTFAPNTAIPLAPLPEQQRIVEKLDALMARISNSKTRLEKIPTLLKNFRQSVLAAAVSGELTKEWREEKKVESAEDLIKSIVKERERWYSKECIAALKNKTKKPRKPKFDINYPIDDLSEYDFPKSWKVTFLEEISAIQENALKAGPFGSSLKKEFYVKRGYKIYGQEQVINADINYGDYYIDENRYKQLESCKIQEGDILISLVGTIGKILIIPKIFEPGIINPRLLKFSLYKTINKEYIKLYLESIIAKRILNKTSHGGTMEILNLEMLKQLPIPLPPIEEQKEIVRKVEELFHSADSIEARYQKAKAWFDKLPQAILAKAFRGELVPQNEEDEPASELLKRIKQAKQTNLPAGKAGHKPTSKAKKRKLYEDNDKLSLVAEE